MKKLFARILFIPVTAYFLYEVGSIIRSGLINFIYYYSDQRSDLYDWLEPFLPIFTLLFIAWITLHFVLEILAYLKGENKFSSWLKHLRFAPIAVLILSGFITLFFDFGMIEYSKWRIRNYIYSNSETVEKPEFRLYNNYRGWCGNGAMAYHSYLYYDTASEGLENENPSMRARALFITHEVADLFNGTDRGRFNAVLIKTCKDKSQIVRNAAESILKGRETNCLNFINLK